MLFLLKIKYLCNGLKLMFVQYKPKLGTLFDFLSIPIKSREDGMKNI